MKTFPVSAYFKNNFEKIFLLGKNSYKNMERVCSVKYYNTLVSNKIFEYLQPLTNRFNNNSLYNAHELALYPAIKYKPRINMLAFRFTLL